MRQYKVICKLFNFNLEQEVDKSIFIITKDNNIIARIEDNNLSSVGNSLLNSIKTEKDFAILNHFIDLGLYLGSLKN